jgi:hypothetical protein
MRLPRTGGVTSVHESLCNPGGGENGDAQQGGWNAQHADAEHLKPGAKGRGDKTDEKEEVEQNPEGKNRVADEIDPVGALPGGHARYFNTISGGKAQLSRDRMGRAWGCNGSKATQYNVW